MAIGSGRREVASNHKYFKNLADGGTKMPSDVRCPECHSTAVQKTGSVMTKSGPKQRYKCTKCATTFYYTAPKPVAGKKRGRSKKS